MATIEELTARVEMLEKGQKNLTAVLSDIPVKVMNVIADNAALIVKKGSRDIFFTVVDSTVEYAKWPFRKAKEVSTVIKVKAETARAAEAAAKSQTA